MDDDDFISKSQRKRDMTRLQRLGEELVGLPAGELARMGLPEDLLEAVLHCKGLSKHEAVRRQMQYIGKVMRHVDPAPIVEHLDRLKAPTKRQTALFHLAERWRDEIVAGDEAMDRFAAQFPDIDRAKLRTLAEDARHERAAAKSPKAFRQLFHYLNDTIQKQPPTT